MEKAEIKSRILWGVVAVFIITFFVVRTIKKDKSLKSEHRYTIGTSLDTHKGIKLPMPSVEFEYYINKKRYIKRQGFNPEVEKVVIGRKYLVMYFPSDLDNSRILLKVPLNDGIQAPNEGWSEAPFGLKESKDIEW
jgi:hypothetical protein